MELPETECHSLPHRGWLSVQMNAFHGKEGHTGCRDQSREGTRRAMANLGVITSIRRTPLTMEAVKLTNASIIWSLLFYSVHSFGVFFRYS